MRAASCFSGIGAAELALPEAQWLWSAEVDQFANAVRAARLDDNCLGSVLADDFLQRASAYGGLDLLIGGPPCQDFSVAGLRQGLDGARGNLTLRWVQIIHALRPVWTVTENVPGWLSVNGGRAFGAFIAGLVGYDTAILPPKGAGGRWTDAGMVDGPEGRLCWRTLDAQFFGLAQRRRRVFVVFCPRGGRDPSQVLFEPSSLRGDTAPGREERQRIAPTLSVGAHGSSGHQYRQKGNEDALIARCLNAHPSRIDGESETFITHQAFDILGTPATRGGAETDVHTALRSRAPGQSEASTTTVIAHSLRADGFDASEDGTGRGTPLVAQAFHQNQRAEVTTNDTAGALNSGGGKPGQGYPAAQIGSAVRRLTPTECERLQGFPDGWTDVAYRGKPAADGPRYRALGNAFAVPVVRWIARRIVREVGYDG